MKLLTDVTTLAASWATVASCADVGLDGSDLTVVCSASTDVLIALVWLGKSLLAELTTLVVSLWIFVSCDCSPLIPLLAFRFSSPLTEFCRLVRSEQ